MESKNFSGGSARPIPPILKKMKFLDSAGRPTELYAQFLTHSKRSHASLSGLKNAFGSIFDVNRFAHTLSEEKVRDIVVEITGLERDDPTLRAIMGTYNAVRSFINLAELDSAPDENDNKDTGASVGENETGGLRRELGLAYNINVIMPETNDITVHNAIFRSLKENLL